MATFETALLNHYTKLAENSGRSYVCENRICHCTGCPYVEKGRASMKDMKMCSGCNIARYCSRDCQKKDWKAHKKICSMLQEQNQNDIENSKRSITKVVDRLNRKNQEWSPHLDRVVDYLAEKAARGTLKKDTKYFLGLIFESPRDAAIWIDNPSVKTHFQVFSRENLVEANNNLCLQLMDQATDSLSLLVFVRVGKICMAFDLNHNRFQPGDRVERWKIPQIEARAHCPLFGTIISTGEVLRSYVVRYSDDEILTDWSHNLRAYPQAEDSHSEVMRSGVDDNLEGKAARRQWCWDIEQCFLASEGRHLQSAFPAFHEKLKRFEKYGEDFGGDMIFMHTPALGILIVPATEDFYVDVPEASGYKSWVCRQADSCRYIDFDAIDLNQIVCPGCKHGRFEIGQCVRVVGIPEHSNCHGHIVCLDVQHSCFVVNIDGVVLHLKGRNVMSTKHHGLL